MSKIGIGIVTFNRLAYLQTVVAAVQANTTGPYELVVADDGSTDGTADWCRSNGVRVVSGANHGVCWNKNRALYALQALGCDPILLLEDDCVPVTKGWDADWRVATALYGHVAFAHAKLDPWIISGTGEPSDPYVNPKATAQCSSASAMALYEVGYFDTRFKGYGVGHAEWTTRMKRVGQGLAITIEPDGKDGNANLYIRGGLEADDAPTFKDKAEIAANQELFHRIKREPVFRFPWSTDDEQARFLDEQRAALEGAVVDANLAGIVGRHADNVTQYRSGLADLRNDDLLEFVLASIADKRPIAVVRFGEGEGRLLVANAEDPETLNVARRKIRRQTGLLLPDRDVLEIRRNIYAALDAADVVGIRGSASFNEEHTMWVNRIEDVFESRLALGRSPDHVSHCLLNNWLEAALPELLRGQEQVSVISCRDIAPVLQEQFAVSDVRMYQVPSQFAVRDVDGNFEAELAGVPIWPQFIRDLQNSIVVRHPGEIFLVGAGLFGKHLCIQIREMGGIALDMGSKLDTMAGKLTRGVRKRAAAAAAAIS